MTGRKGVEIGSLKTGSGEHQHRSRLMPTGRRIEHLRPAGRTLDVQSVSAVQRGSRLRAEAPEADQSRIFEQYERAASTNLGGLGLGLWLVRQLARAHGGEVAVRSCPGQGASFTVTLPRRMGAG